MLTIYGIPLDSFLASEKIRDVKVLEFDSFWIVEFFRDGWRFVKSLNDYEALRQRGSYVYSFSPRKIVGDGEHDSLTRESAIHKAAIACFCYGNSVDGYRYYPGTLRQFESNEDELEKYYR